MSQFNLGIDIGTSKVAIVIFDPSTGKVLSANSRLTNADLVTDNDFSEQDEGKIHNTILATINSISPELKNNLKGIGFTGQMHGVILWNETSCSPLITWKDQRASNSGLLKKINKIPGCNKLKDGFGTTTLAWMQEYNQLSQWKFAATIHDYFVSKICDLKSPVTSPSDAASWGAFNVLENHWDEKAISQLGISKKFFPEILSCGETAGHLSKSFAGMTGLPEGIPVYVPLGDNQASILATAKEAEEEIYLTLGTGAQLSIILSKQEMTAGEWPESVEIRPYPGDKFLAVAAPLCGGQAMAWLIKSINNWLRDLGLDNIPEDELFISIDNLALKCIDSPLTIKPNFLGERHQPDLRGKISNIDLENCSLGNAAASLARGIVENMYKMVPEKIIKSRKRILGSGNAVRRLKIIKTMIEKVFQMPLEVVEGKEEAATGAAMIPDLRKKKITE